MTTTYQNPFHMAAELNLSAWVDLPYQDRPTTHGEAGAVLDAMRAEALEEAGVVLDVIAGSDTHSIVYREGMRTARAYLELAAAIDALRTDAAAR